MTYDLKVRENLPCWAGNEKNCKVLKRYMKKDCLTCNFYKPIRDHELSQERAIKRLKTLDKAERLKIAEKYNIKEIV